MAKSVNIESGALVIWRGDVVETHRCEQARRFGFSWHFYPEVRGPALAERPAD